MAKVRLISEEAIKQVQQAQLEVDKLIDKFIKLYETTGKQAVEPFKVEGSKELENFLKNLDKSQKKLAVEMANVNNASAQQERVLKKLVQSEKNLADAKTETYAKTVKNRQLVADENKRIKASESRYARLNLILGKLRKEYQDLAIKKELNGKLDVKQTARLETLTKRVQMLDKAFKSVDKGMGVYSRSVGNYGSAFDSLGFSVAQLTRESPAFLNSMQTGFMALSNNIPIFVDEIQKLTIANKKLKDAGEPTVNVFKKVAGAFLGWQSLISFGIVLLTMYGSQVVEMTKNFLEQQGVIKSTKEGYDSLDDSMQQSIGRMIGLVGVANDASVAEGKRLKAIQELNDEYPTFNTNILKEKDNTDLVNQEIEKQIELLIKRARAKGLEQEIADTSQELEKKNAVTKKLMIGLSEDEIQAAIDLNKLHDEERPKRKEDILFTQKELAARGKLTQQQLQLAAAMQNERPQREKLNGLLEEFNDNLEVEAGLIEGTVEWYREKIRVNNELIEKSGDRTEIAKIQDENEFLQEQLDFLLGVNKRKEERSKALKGELADENGILVIQRKRLKWMERLLELETDPARQEILRKAIAAQKEIVESEEKGTQRKLYGQEQVEQGMKDYLKLLELAKKANKQLTEEEMNRLESLIEQLRLVNEVVQSGADLGVAIIERRIVAIEEERDAVLESYDDQMDAADNLLMSEENKAAEKERLEKEKEAREKEYNRRLAKERKKQAIIDKAAAVADIAIVTAQSIVRAKLQSFYLPPIAGDAYFAAQMAFILASSALQAAAVLATPIPKYAQGKDASDNYQGYALLNDAGRTEYREDKKGNIYEIKGRNTVGWVDRDDIVHKSKDAMLEYHAMVYNSSILTGVNSSNKNLSDYQAQKDLESRIANEQFKKDVKDILRGWKFHNHIDHDRMASAIASAMDQLNYKGKLLN